MRIVVSTVIRHSLLTAPYSGRIFDLDFEKKTILHELPVPQPIAPRSVDNPRGGGRGGRGISVLNDKIYIANYDTIFVYDLDFNEVDRFSNPLFSDIHEIEAHEDGVWITLTALDLLLKSDFSGNVLEQWYIREDKELRRKLNIEMPPSIDWQVDYRRHHNFLNNLVHINNVQKIGNYLYINLGKVYNKMDKMKSKGLKSQGLLETIAYSIGKSRWLTIPKRLLRKTLFKHSPEPTYSHIVKLDLLSKQADVMFQCPVLRPSHNGQQFNEKFLILNVSETSDVILIYIENQEIAKKIHVEGKWLRGLTKVNESQILVGCAPATVNRIDLNREEVVERFVLSEEPNESIHGLDIVSRE